MHDDDVYQAPESFLKPEKAVQITGFLPFRQAILIAPAATPVVWMLGVTLLFIENGGLYNSSSIFVWLMVALLIPLVISYAVTFLLAGPLYWLFYKNGWTGFIRFNSSPLISACVLYLLICLYQGRLFTLWLLIALVACAFFNSCLMWFLACKGRAAIKQEKV